MKRWDARRDPVLQMVREVRGTAVRIAEACGINREAVWNWNRVPAQHVIPISKLLRIPRHHIRPDIYPPPQSRGAQPRNGRKQHGGSARA